MLMLINKSLKEDYVIDIEKLPEDERHLYIHIVQANDINDIKK